jgi:soluble lytic murein transglycosylase
MVTGKRVARKGRTSASRPLFAAVTVHAGFLKLDLFVNHIKGMKPRRAVLSSRGARDTTVIDPLSTRILMTLVGAGILMAVHAPVSAQALPLPKPRPASAPRAAAPTSHVAGANNPATAATALPARPPTPAASPRPLPPSPRFALATTDATPPADLTAIKEAVAAARKSDVAYAGELQNTIADPLARKLVEWAILRSEGSDSIELGRYTAFLAENPSWPSISLIRRRAEAALWAERPDPGTVRAFFAKTQPSTAKGKFALARALLLLGERQTAQNLVREAWRNDGFGSDLEGPALDIFSDLLTTADHKARMETRLYADDTDGALRAADRAGGTAPAIARARIAVIKKAANAKGLLDGLPADARREPGYIFSRAQLLARADKAAEAADLILSLPHDQAQASDADQWWVERRLIARKLLDLGKAKTAYRLLREAAPPHKENYRVDQDFTCGWIALHFLHEPAAALAHFAQIAHASKNPIALARSGYWQGLAAEALGRKEEAKGHFETAARYPTAYYGQIARARLGHHDIALRPLPQPREGTHPLEVVRAIELLYSIDERDLIAGALADLGERSTDAAALATIAEVAAQHNDARATALLGKAALARGLPLESYAFPTFGIPEYSAIGPTLEPAVVYAIARQESTFNPKTVSSARAMGLMQVTPAAARYVTGKFHAPYDERRLLSDQSYNVQLGAAEVGDLLVTYRGSYILAFAGYNAGPGRVKEWIAKHGDPRDPKVDPIDWVERIPFSETRNYVQRVMENLQIYRVRFGGNSKLLIEADLRRGGASN